MQPILSQHNPVTTFATLWKITLQNGKVLGFTDHDQDIFFEGAYYIASSGFTPHALENQLNCNNNHLEIEGLLNHDSITAEDLSSGRYDNAQIDIFMIDYTNLDSGAIFLKHGFFGDITISPEAQQKFTVEILGLADKLETKIGETYSPICRAKFCDSKCGLIKEDYTYQATIEEIISKNEFLINEMVPNHQFFDHGVITFISGKNIQLSFEIIKLEENRCQLYTATPYEINEGDSISITAGCDKQFKTCKLIYNNAINFRGEPHIPGIEKLLNS